jgi:hypothetical protein
VTSDLRLEDHEFILLDMTSFFELQLSSKETSEMVVLTYMNLDDFVVKMSIVFAKIIASKKSNFYF